MDLVERTVFQQLQRIGWSQPDQVALSTDDQVWTYADLCDEAERLASGLVATAGSNQRSVAVISENRAEVLVCWLAGSRSGLTTSMLNPRLTPSELSRMLGKLRPGLVVAEADCVSRGMEAMDLAGIDAPVVLLGDRPVEGCARFEDLMASAPYRGAHPDGDEIFEVAWTSGTTSDPKGVALSHSGIVSHWDAVRRAIGLVPADVAYVVTPLYHQSGLRHTTLVTWLGGGRAHLAAHFSPKIYWQDVERIGATYTCLVPTMRSILRAATPEEWETGRPVRGPGFCYGSTETGVPVVAPYGMPDEELSSYQSYRPGATFAGWPTPGCEVKLAGEGESAEEGMTGEILVKSPGGVCYYWGDPAASEAAFASGWFKSGDQGMRGPNGTIYFLDRLRDLVRRGGENIACSEIEEVLTGYPGVQQATVFSVPDPIWAEEAKAIVVTADGTSVNPNDLWAWCQKSLAEFKIPRYIEFRDDLPVSTSGKVQKVVLRQEGIRPDRTYDRAKSTQGVAAGDG